MNASSPKRKLAATAVAFGLLFAGIPAAFAAGILRLDSMRLHDFDAAIISLLAYDDKASITYFKELGSINNDELKERQSYEGVACFPFYVMRLGQVDEKGYNCRSFFCVGYKKGPQLCRDVDGRPYGGVVEIQNRLSEVHPPDQKKLFADYGDQQTPEMRALVDQLALIRCRPFYIVEYGVAVGQGYECDEVGQYPNYSAKNACRTDWRHASPKLTCDVAQREDEVQIRMRALGVREASSSSSSSVAMTSSSSSVPASSSSAPFIPVSPFPDVIQGHYGYTAITSLAFEGIVHGYADGNFRPTQIVNRAEFLVLLMRGLYPEEIRGEEKCFPDVQTTWYSAEVCAAKRLGWISGYGDGLFRPAQSISKAEGLKIVMSTMGPVANSSTPLPTGAEDGQWYSPYVRQAIDTKVLLEASFSAPNAAIRADAAVWMYRAKKAISMPTI
jgi:hypothetical protein